MGAEGRRAEARVAMTIPPIQADGASWEPVTNIDKEKAMRPRMTTVMWKNRRRASVSRSSSLPP